MILSYVFTWISGAGFGAATVLGWSAFNWFRQMRRLRAAADRHHHDQRAFGAAILNPKSPIQNPQSPRPVNHMPEGEEF